VCRTFNEKYPDVLRFATQMEGLSRQAGIHAAGVVTSPVPITDIVPVEMRNITSAKPVKVTAIDFWGAGALGLLKLDVLGLRTLTVLKDATRAIKERHDVDVDLEALPLDDPKVFQNFTDMAYVGIFQFDSVSVEKICERVTFDHFNDVTAINALNRPGTMRSGLATKWAERKMGRAKIEKIHPIVDEICSSTLGIIVFQEQVTRIFQDLAGYDPGSADSLRKAIAKKEGEETMGKERGKFVAGALERGCSEEAAGKLIDAITFFGSYGFNRSHAAAYGAIAYWGMWLKTYYPAELAWALLKNEPDLSQVARYVKEARRLGNQVLPPSVNTSGNIWVLSGDNNIEPSLIDIKGVGEKAATAIMEAQPFKDLADFLERINRRHCHRGVITTLAKAGAMRDMLTNIKVFIDNAEDILKRKPQQAMEHYQEMCVGAEDYTEDDLFVIQSDVCPLSTGKHPLEAYGEVFERMGEHVEFESMAEPEWEKRLGWFSGQMVEIKYNQVGDFHSVEPDEAEKERIGWGKRYANINVEDTSNVQQRIKVDIDIFEDYRHIIDKGQGTCVALCCSKAVKSHTMRCNFMADLEEMRQDLKHDRPWTGSAAFFESHPVLANGGHKARLDKVLGKKAPRARMVARDVIVWILYVREHRDKKGNLMAFFDMAGTTGSVGGLCFGSSYEETYKGHLKAGTIVKIDLVRGDRPDTWILDSDQGCKLKILSKLSAK